MPQLLPIRIAGGLLRFLVCHQKARVIGIDWTKAIAKGFAHTGKMKKNGFSLIELLVVMIILGIVASLGTVSFTGWVRKHDLESQVKEMYTDLMNARLTAMHQNRTILLLYQQIN